MNDQTTTGATALSAGIELTAPPVMSDIKATAGELMQHIEDVHLSNEASKWLQNARSALASAVHYMEAHFASFEANLKAEVAAVEETVKSEVSAVEAKLDEPLSSIEAAAAGAATAASAV